MKRFKIKGTHKGENKSYVVLVDDEDACLLRVGAWYIGLGRDNHPYVKRCTGRSTAELLHRDILKTKNRVYHINGNGLDNRRSNLSLVAPRASEGRISFNTGMRALNRLICHLPTGAAPYATAP